MSPVPLSLAQQTLDPRVLDLIVFPTERCNFRCTYCYEDFLLGKMSSSTQEGLERLIANRAADTDRMTISWFGGEPLLALDVVHRISSFAKEYFPAPKLFASGMTTNGYRLDLDTFTGLLDSGVTQFQISLDGPRDVHDRTRVRADGKGTFDRIWNNLRAIASFASKSEAAFHIVLRLHYDADSAYVMTPLIDAIEDELSDPTRFSVLFHEIEKLGGPNDATIRLPSSKEHAHVRRLADRIAGAQRASNRHELAIDVDSYICYAARANSLVIRSDGRIAKCTVALNDERNVIGSLAADGTVQLDDDRLKPWIRGAFSGDPTELACPLESMPL